MKFLGRVLKFLFPKFVERLVMLDKISNQFEYNMFLYKLNDDSFRYDKVNALADTFNSQKMWFMAKKLVTSK